MPQLTGQPNWRIPETSGGDVGLGKKKRTAWLSVEIYARRYAESNFKTPGPLFLAYIE
jgi:hypothetical protein